MSRIDIRDYVSTDAASRAALREQLGGLTTLARVLAWGQAQSPPITVDDILTQDEYTHDVFMTLDRHRHLVFDTT